MFNYCRKTGKRKSRLLKEINDLFTNLGVFFFNECVFVYRLMKSGINPFDSQEAKPYKNDPEILAMTNLVVSYQNNDINEFESILRHNRSNIMADPFIREHIEDLLRNIRTQVLIKLIRPYKNIAIPFIANALNIEPAEVESLLVSCILDK